MKRIYALVCAALAALLAPAAMAATYYISTGCGAGAMSQCAGAPAGNNSNSTVLAQDPATPWLNCSKFYTQFPSLAAGDSILFARGGADDSCVTTNLANFNSTSTNRVTIGAYTPTGYTTASGTSTGTTATTLTDTNASFPALTGYEVCVTGYPQCPIVASNTSTVLTLTTGFVGGVDDVPASGMAYTVQAAKPILHGVTTSTIMSFTNSSGPNHKEGVNVQYLHFKGDASSSAGACVFISNDSDYISLLDNEFEGCGNNVVLNGGWIGVRQGNSNGMLDHIEYMRNFNHDSATDSCFLGAANYLLIEKNTHWACGRDATLDHNLYIDGIEQISSITMTIADPAVITWTDHRLVVGDQVSPSQGSFPPPFVNGVDTPYYVTTVVDVNHIRVSTTRGGTEVSTLGSTDPGGTQRLTHDITSQQITIRGNSLIDNEAHGSQTGNDCAAVSLVVHGMHNNLIIDDNKVKQTTPPAGTGSGGCWGIQVGRGYPDGREEGYTRVSVRRNSVVNVSRGITVDQCRDCVIESNTIYTAMTVAKGLDAGIAVRATTNTVNPTSDSLFDIDRIKILNNTIYIANPGANIIGIRTKENASDTHTYSGHEVTGNIIYFGAGSTGSTACFDTTNMTAGRFTRFAENLCFFAGTTGLWDTASQQVAGGADKTADPLFTATPAAANNYSTALQAGSPAVAACATGCSATSFGRKAPSGVRDIGAEHRSNAGATPSPPVNILGP